MWIHIIQWSSGPNICQKKSLLPRGVCMLQSEYLPLGATKCISNHWERTDGGQQTCLYLYLVLMVGDDFLKRISIHKVLLLINCSVD